MEVICLESEAFYSLVKEVVNRIKAEQNITEDKWISGDEAMRLLNIKSKTTLQKLRDEGQIKFSQPSKKIILYDRDSIKDYLDSNARVYTGVLGAFKTYRKGIDIRFENINYAFLKAYEKHYFAQGFSVNGLSLIMRTLRAIFNKAIKAGIVERQYYPFVNYSIKSEKPAKRALDKDTLQQIFQLELDPEHECFHARNIFVASFRMYGMSFIDMAFLKVRDIQDGQIKYRRRKTGQSFDIKIAANLAPIIDFYARGKKKSDFLFPVLRRSDLEDQYRDLDQGRKVYNKALKQLAVLCGIEQKLTSYVSRHSFATMAMVNDVPIKAISQMLGHTSLSTTEIYLKSLPSEVLDGYNEVVNGI